MSEFSLSVQKTSMLKSGGTCKLAELPGNINVSAIAAEFGGKNVRMAPETVTTFILKARESRLGSKKRSELLPEAQDLCKNVPMVKTNDIKVNETEFEKLRTGEVITLKNPKSKRTCLQVCSF